MEEKKNYINVKRQYSIDTKSEYGPVRVGENYIYTESFVFIYFVGYVRVCVCEADWHEDIREKRAREGEKDVGSAIVKVDSRND